MVSISSIIMEKMSKCTYKEVRSDDPTKTKMNMKTKMKTKTKTKTTPDLINSCYCIVAHSSL